MTKQAIVIGLGQFGMSLARSLASRGVEVMAVDTKEDRVRAAGAFTEAITLDATDEAALAHISPHRRDLCICAIGDEAREASIICTALLRQVGAPRVVARATDPLHERILHLVGAHEVVNPERAFGERLATRILYSGVIDEIPLGEDLVISEIRPPESLVGRTLAELALPRKHAITVIAVRREGTTTVAIPDPQRPLRPNDILVVVARPGTVSHFLERI